VAEVGLAKRFDAALLSRRRVFRFRVDGDADAVWARMLADPSVREADDPAPEPAPPQGAALLVSRSGGTIRVRHWSGAADAVSPVLVLRIDGHGDVARVEGHLEQPGHAASFRALQEPRRLWPVILPIGVLAGIGVLAYVVAGSALLWTLPLLLLLFAIPSSLVMLPALALWNAESRRVQRDALVTWMGRTFVPIALPATDEDDPFR
jgi:hypothetical protein